MAMAMAMKMAMKMKMGNLLRRSLCLSAVKSVESDVVVIGGGHEGTAAALKAAEMDLKTTIIEGRGLLGGTSPPKALLHFYEPKHAPTTPSQIEADLPAMTAQRDKAAACLSKGIEGIFRKHGVNYIKGYGRFMSPTHVSVGTPEGEVLVKGQHIIIATGSCVESSRQFKLCEKKIVSSTEALSLSEIPRRAVVVGANFIGLEIGSMWARLGSKVMVVDLAPDIIPTMDSEIRTKLMSILLKQKLEFMLETKVVGLYTSSSPGVKLTIQPVTGGQQSTLETDLVLVPERRAPNTKGLCLENIGVGTDVDAGGIIINERFKTSLERVYAIGDVVAPRPMLAANKASKDAVECLKVISGIGQVHMDFDKVPGILYTHDEVGSIGMTEEQLNSTDVKYRVHRRKLEDAEGFAKILEDENTNKILGVHILSPTAEAKIGHVANAWKYSDGEAKHVVARTVQSPIVPRHLSLRTLAWTAEMY